MFMPQMKSDFILSFAQSWVKYSDNQIAIRYVHLTLTPFYYIYNASRPNN